MSPLCVNNDFKAADDLTPEDGDGRSLLAERIAASRSADDCYCHNHEDMDAETYP